jgi:hypothetical protein
MQDEKENIPNSDLENQIRQKLENHTFSVEDSVWNEIESGLNQKSRKVIPFWYWLSGGAAVAVLALLFTIRPLNNETQVLSTLSQKSETFGNQSDNTKIINTPNSKFSKLSVKSNKHLLAKTKSSTTLYVVDFLHIEPVESDSVRTANINSNQFSENSNMKIIDNQSDTASELKKQETYPVWDNKVTASQKGNAKSKNNGILLAAAFSAGGSVPTGSNGYEMAVGDRNIVAAVTNYTAVMTPNDFSQITYFTPVSFGFTIQKPLSNALKIESGLVYTYLSTNFKNSSVQQSVADLHLHYVGIPINLVGRILESNKWEFYYSAGAMIEKGIRSIYIQNQIYGNQTITTTASTNIAGLQWSVNGAIGTTYKLDNIFGIYFEPKISYFFNNNQPISARSNQPVSISLTAGLRFQIK